MQLPIIIVIQQQNPDLFFISRLHTQSNYQSLWRKIPLGRLSSCSSVQSARKKISALDFFWCVLIYLSIYFCNCKPTRSHTTAAYIFTYLLTWSPPPFPNRIPDSFSSLWALCARGSYCPGGDTGPEPWSCQGFRVPSHSLSQQQNSWGTKLHPKKAWSTPPRKTPQCRAVLLAVTPLTDLASSTTQPLLKDINHGSSYVLELQPHTGSLPVHM